MDVREQVCRWLRGCRNSLHGRQEDHLLVRNAVTFAHEPNLRLHLHRIYAPFPSDRANRLRHLLESRHPNAARTRAECPQTQQLVAQPNLLLCRHQQHRLGSGHEI